MLDSTFLLMQTLGGGSDDPSSRLLATHMGDLVCIPASSLQHSTANANIWGTSWQKLLLALSSWTTISLSLRLKKKIKFKTKRHDFPRTLRTLSGWVRSCSIGLCLADNVLCSCQQAAALFHGSTIHSSYHTEITYNCWQTSGYLQTTDYHSTVTKEGNRAFVMTSLTGEDMRAKPGYHRRSLAKQPSSFTVFHGFPLDLQNCHSCFS